jgi:hypothetical protein
MAVLVAGWQDDERTLPLLEKVVMEDRQVEANAAVSIPDMGGRSNSRTARGGREEGQSRSRCGRDGAGAAMAGRPHLAVAEGGAQRGLGHKQRRSLVLPVMNLSCCSEVTEAGGKEGCLDSSLPSFV